MHKLISELRRLYLLDNQELDETIFAQHLRGEKTCVVDLADALGSTRALVIDFHQRADGQHWERVRDVANALQSELGLPAPAVSVSGARSYRLWLSLETTVSAAQAEEFLVLLHEVYFADEEIDTARTIVELPPCLHKASKLWAAFINPGMGASFSEELGLEMPPPVTAQAAFLEGLRSMTAAEFSHALSQLQKKYDVEPAAPAPPSSPRPDKTPAGLLLKDATLEDIIQLLHDRNIEPTFRHLVPK
jgi:hypothetical protein